MKKIITLSLIAFGFTFTSCKKSFQCDCNAYDPQGVYKNTNSTTYKERKREDAQSACVAKSNVTASETVKCVIIN